MRRKIVWTSMAALVTMSMLSISASSVAPGQGFTVTISCGNVEGTVSAVGNNATVTGSGNWCDRGKSVTVSATAGGAGTASVSLVGVDATDASSMSDYSGKTIGTASVNVVASANNSSNGNTNTTTNKEEPKPANEQPKEDKKEEKKLSSNANLASLTLSQGTLSPKFAASKTSYTVNLTGDVNSVTIKAKAADAKASVYGDGTIKLKPGKNTATISVSAEDGSVKEYEIIIQVDETPVVFLTYNGTKLGVVRNLSGVDKPAKSFEPIKLTIDGKNVQGWKSNLLKKTVLYMQEDATKEKQYYVYNEESKTIETKLVPMALLGHNIFVVDIPKNMQTREGMEFTTIKVDKYELPGWKFKDASFANYALLYVMDEKGNMVYYQYEDSEKSLQRYSNAAAISQSAYDQYRKDVDASLKKHKMVIYGLAAGCVVLAGACILLFVRRKKHTKYKKVDVHHTNHVDSVEASALSEDKIEE